MEMVKYTDLNLKESNDFLTFVFNGQNIKVKQYLSASDKYDLIMITLQKSKENGIFNPFKLDLFFHLHLVFMYTNLSFTNEERENELELFDKLKSSGFINTMLSYIPVQEYNDLINFIEETKCNTVNYSNSIGATIQKVINDLPANAQAAMEIVDNFDKEKYQEVLSFAESANAGRSISK